MPLKNIENPQIYTVVPKEIIKNQLLLSNREIVNNSVGVVAFNNPTGAVTAWIRGFETRNAIRNGMATQFRAESDPINIERIEVVKGPSGTLYGAGNSQAVSFGGLINKVTKIPHQENSAEVGVYTGSYDLMRITADVNRALNKEKTALFRVNTAYNYQHSFQDIGNYRNITFSPSFLYKVSEKFEILAETEFASVNNTQMPYPNLGGGFFKNFKDIPIAYDKYIGGDDVGSKSNIANLFVKATYKLSDKWTSTTNINSSTGFVDYSYQLYPRWTSNHEIERNVGLYSARKLSFIQFQQNFNGEFNLGKIKNRVLLGVDYTKNNAELNFQWAKYDDIDINKDFKPIIKAKIDGILGAGNANHWNSTEHTRGVYVSDVINFTDNLTVLLSGRFDSYKYEPSVDASVKQDNGFEQNFFSPKVGLVYQLFKDKVSVFGNYMNGFINQGPVTQPNGEKFVVKPKKAYQTELGIKTQLINKKLFTTLSFYQIDVNDATWTDKDNFTKQGGKQRSKGFEFEVIAQLNNFSVIGGIAYNENKFIEGQESLVGKMKQGAPKNIYNLWVDYKFDEGFLNNIRIGAGLNSVSKVFWDTQNTITMPGYTVVNQSISYEKPNWTLSFKANNLMNAHYWNSDAQPQMPRNFAVSLLFKI